MRSVANRHLFAITAFSFSLTIAVNVLNPAVFGHKIIQVSDPTRYNTILGLTTFAGSVVSILALPMIGAWSDRTNTRWGKRFPFFFAGTILLLIALYWIANATSLTSLFSGMMLYFIADNFIFGPWMALYPDHIANHQRGQASGIKAFSEVIGLIIGRVGAGYFLGRSEQLGPLAANLTVSIPAIITLVSFAITRTATNQLPLLTQESEPKTILQALASAYRIDWNIHPAFKRWFLNRFLFWGAFQAAGTFLLFFIISALSISEAEAQEFLGLLTPLIGGATLLIAIPAGRWADKWGRRPIVALAGFMAGAGVFYILTVKDLNLLILGGLVIGLGSGMFISANFALLTDIVPANKAAQYLGVASVASSSGSAFGRLLGGLIVDPINATFESTSAGYYTLYGIVGILFIFSALAALSLPKVHDPIEN